MFHLEECYEGMWGYVQAVVDLIWRCFCVVLSLCVPVNQLEISSPLAEFIVYELFDWLKSSVQDEFFWHYVANMSDVVWATTSMCADILYICEVFVLREGCFRQSQSTFHTLHAKNAFYSLLFLLNSFSWRFEKNRC